MNNSMKRNIIRVILISFMLCLTISNVAFAKTTTIGPVKVETDKNVNTTDIENTAGRIIGVIQVVGILIAVGVIMVLGIKYMMGSAEEKAEYKKVFVPYIIGAIILFAASALADAVYKMINSF